MNNYTDRSTADLLQVFRGKARDAATQQAAQHVWAILIERLTPMACDTLSSAWSHCRDTGSAARLDAATDRLLERVMRSE